MKETNFCYWLQGYFELTENKSMTEKQVKVIKEHLALVMNKTTLLSVDSIAGIDLSKATGIIC